MEGVPENHVGEEMTGREFVALFSKIHGFVKVKETFADLNEKMAELEKRSKILSKMIERVLRRIEDIFFTIRKEY